MSNDIDRLVAEKVMGWEVHPRDTANYIMAGDPAYHRGCQGHTCGNDVFTPSTRIEHAMEVVDKLLNLNLSVGTIMYPDGKTTCIITSMNTPESYQMTCDSPMQAICRTALLAVGVEA